MRVYHTSRSRLPASAVICVAVSGDRLEHDGGPLLLAEASIAPGNGQTGSKPLDVPLPGSGKGLVEVVEVEDQIPLRRSEDTEVAQVGIAAGLDVSPERGVVDRSEAMISAAPR